MLDLFKLYINRKFVTSSPRGGEVKPLCYLKIKFPHPFGIGGPLKKIFKSPEATRDFLKPFKAVYRSHRQLNIV